jgi:hypothetical protein
MPGRAPMDAGCQASFKFETISAKLPSRHADATRKAGSLALERDDVCSGSRMPSGGSSPQLHSSADRKYMISSDSNTRAYYIPVPGAAAGQAARSSIEPHRWIPRPLRSDAYNSALVGEDFLRSFDNLRWRVKDVFYQRLEFLSGCRLNIHPALFRLVLGCWVV